MGQSPASSKPGIPVFHKRRVIIVRLIGGLGNQLFQYAVGRQLSILHDAALKVDVSSLQQDAARPYKLHHFNVSCTMASQKEVEKYTGIYEQHTLYARIYRKAEGRLLPRYKRRYFKEAGYYEFEPDLLKVQPNVLIEGFWQHYKYFENLHPQIGDELTLKEEYATLKPEVISAIEQDESSVSLHVRRGDYVSDPNNLSWFGVMPVSYYQNAMAYMGQRVNNPTFYVFSDDLDWAKQNLPQNGQLVFVDIEGGTKDYLELEAMRRCRHHIIANSSFSWWGAYLNKRKDKVVIAPARWIADEEVNKHVAIQFPSWIKM